MVTPNLAHAIPKLAKIWNIDFIANVKATATDMGYFASSKFPRSIVH